MVAGVGQARFRQEFLGRRPWHRFHVDIDRLDIRFRVYAIFADFDGVRCAPNQVTVIEIAVGQYVLDQHVESVSALVDVVQQSVFCCHCFAKGLFGN